MERLGKMKASLSEIRQHIGQYQLQSYTVSSVAAGKNFQAYVELMNMYRMLSSMRAAMGRDMAIIKSHLSIVENREEVSRPGKLATDRIERDDILTTREIEVLELFSRGCSYNETADLLHCRLATVQTHCKRIYRKLHVHSRSEAIFEASLLGLILI